MGLTINSRMSVPSGKTANMMVVHKKGENVTLQDTKGRKTVVHELQVHMSGTNEQNLGLKAIKNEQKIQDPPKEPRDFTLKRMAEDILKETIDRQEQALLASVGSQQIQIDKISDLEIDKKIKEPVGTTTDYLNMKQETDLRKKENPVQNGLEIYKNFAETPERTHGQQRGYRNETGWDKR